MRVMKTNNAVDVWPDAALKNFIFYIFRMYEFSHSLALQLRSPFYVGSAGFGLMCASPDGPCDDVGGPDASLRKTNSDAPDFLNCPADQELRGPFIPRVF